MCGKKVEYLSLYEEKKKKGSAGFLRMLKEGDKVRFTLQIRAEKRISGKYPLYLITGEEKILWTAVALTEGKGSYEKCFPECEGGLIANSKRIIIREIEAVCLEISEKCQVRTYWEADADRDRKADIDRDEEVSTDRTCKADTDQDRKADTDQDRKADTDQDRKADADQDRKADADQDRKTDTEQDVERDFVKKQELNFRETISAERQMRGRSQCFLPDKWEQLLQQYRRVHPFGDDRLFISIELKDFVILREEYQKLVHNSFLLHGFYNYQHLILGKDCRIGREGEQCFYLGVPGVFYEREKMVAVMFGFEGFECEGPVETGKVGYYLRQVKI